MKKISVELDEDLLRRLTENSGLTGSSPEHMVADAVTHYIYYHGSHQCMLAKSLEALRNGDIASPDDIAGVFGRWGVQVTPDSNIVWSGLALRAWSKDLEAFAEYGADVVSKVARQIWQCLQTPGLAQKAFPGQLRGTLEAHIEGCPYSVTFMQEGGILQILGISQQNG